MRCRHQTGTLSPRFRMVFLSLYLDGSYHQPKLLRTRSRPKLLLDCLLLSNYLVTAQLITMRRSNSVQFEWASSGTLLAVIRSNGSLRSWNPVFRMQNVSARGKNLGRCHDNDYFHLNVHLHWLCGFWLKLFQGRRTPHFHLNNPLIGW